MNMLPILKSFENSVRSLFNTSPAEEVHKPAVATASFAPAPSVAAKPKAKKTAAKKAASKAKPRKAGKAKPKKK